MNANTPIYVSHDSDYTYGGIHIGWLEERWVEDEDEDPDAIYN
jgi:hypothetical protein